ncbi:MAG: hypothetical protein ACE15D_01285 [Candidatus Eisenbacteria bacterium]
MAAKVLPPSSWLLVAGNTEVLAMKAHVVMTRIAALCLSLWFLSSMSSTSMAQYVPDPEHCSVLPWDGTGRVLVIPGSTVSLDRVTVTVRNVFGDPMADVAVEIVFQDCLDLCIDPEDPDLGPKRTDGAGRVEFNPRVGGCADCGIEVVADGIPIRHFTTVVSPDWDGWMADGIVDDGDWTFFDVACGMDPLPPCVDYNGDGVCSASDMQLLAQSTGSVNPGGLCGGGPIEPWMQQVRPWDVMQHALVSPGASPQSSAVDSVTIVAVDAHGDAWEGVEVVLRTDCPDLCIDPVDPDMGPKWTDADGMVTFNPKIGGCGECAFSVLFFGIEIRHYSRVVSPDWDGERADGKVDAKDQEWFEEACAQNDPCADLNGDGTCTPADLQLFALAMGDRNPNGLCLLPGAAPESPAEGGLSLGSVVPNPSRAGIAYSLRLDRAASVRARILDVAGRIVATPLEGELAAGDHALRWDRPDGGLPAGVYFLSVEMGERRFSRLFVLLD